MAKQRRSKPKLKTKPKPKKVVRARRPARPASARAASSVVPAPSAREMAHRDAMAAYERGLQALQHHEYARASKLLQAVLDGYAEEKELHERVRLYLNVCRRQTVPPDATPRSVEERVYAATLAINSGAYDTGLAQLETLQRDKPDNDHVQYMLAVVHNLRRDPVQALSHLQRSVELNAENRFLAWHDADLEGLREHPKFRASVGVTSTRRERREPTRARAR